MHELRKRKNKVRIAITCPVLEVPFCNNLQWRYESERPTDSSKMPEVIVEEKWVIAMGDLFLTNYKDGRSKNTIQEQGDVT